MKRIIILLSAVGLLGIDLVLMWGAGPAAGQEVKPPKMVPGPWSVAKVGDTMVHRDSLDSVSTHTVIKVDETTVTVEASGTKGGKALPKHTLTWPRMISPPIVAAEGSQPVGDKLGTKIHTKHLRDETLEISGQKIVCKVKELTFTQGEKKLTVRKFWTSDQVPGGSVKAVMVNGTFKYVVELVEFKRGK